MITEDYIRQFETAKLLKEKGFDEEIESLITPTGKIYFLDENSVERSHHKTICNSKINTYSNDVSCPTLQMAMKWLREMCKCYIHIVPFYPHGTYSEPPKWLVAIDANYVPYPTMKNNFETYEEAAEAAIKYSLENLI